MSRARAGAGWELLAGPHAVHEALRAGRRRLHRLLVARQEAGELLEEILGLARGAGVAIQGVARAELDRQLPAGAHQGIVAEASPYPYGEAESLLEAATRGPEPGWILVLDGILDPQNLGAMARTAEAAGVAGLVLPRDRAAAVTPAAVRASAGATEHLVIARVSNLATFLVQAKARGLWVVGAEAAGGQALYAVDLTGALALVVGGEGRGLRALTRRHCDFLVRIPTRGRVASLNASAATAICLYEGVRQRWAGRGLSVDKPPVNCV